MLSFDAAAEPVFGYERDEAIGRPLADLIIPPALRAAHWAGLARVGAGGEPRLLGKPVELVGMRADGSTLPVEPAGFTPSPPRRRDRCEHAAAATAPPR